MRGFNRGEKGFTLVELLIVVAILGILAAVVIPNVVGLLGRGGKQAYQTDVKTIELAASTFFADVQDGYLASAKAWTCTNGNLTTAGHYYPDGIADVSGHYLTASVVTTDADPKQSGSMLILGNGTTAATTADIQATAIWMGLLVNPAAASTLSQPGGTTNRWSAQPLYGKNALYLEEMPKSAMIGALYNGDSGGAKGGGYCWIVGANGQVMGAYKKTLTQNVDGWIRATGDYWFSGFSGAYP